MTNITTAALIGGGVIGGGWAARLIENGIDTLYCVPGVQNDNLFDAIYHRQQALRPVHARHEQGAVYMALGAALATGRPQAYSVVPGPGFLNGTAALCTAQALNTPLLPTSKCPPGAQAVTTFKIMRHPSLISKLKPLQDKH